MNKSGVDMAAWHSMEAAQALKELDTDLESGLTEDEARRRLQRYGYNELTKKEQRISPLAIFINQFKNILIAILLVAAVLSAVIGEWMGAVLILVIVIFCAVLGFVQEYRAERALEALKKMLSPTTTLLREGREEEIPSRELVPGGHTTS
jgi:P-type Ca2+ transporter type 2C